MIAAMDTLRGHAERLRIAALLEVEPDRLACLQDLSAHELVALHDACRAALHEAHRPLYQRLARSSRLLPASLSAWIAEHTLGPLLAAHTAAEMSVPATMAMCRHLSARFMAEVTPHLELDRVTELTVALPMAQVEACTRELLARREYMTLGRMVDRMPPAITERLAGTLLAPDDLLRAALFIEDGDRLLLLVEQMPPHALVALVETATDPLQGLLPHGLYLLRRLPPVWQRRFIDTALVGGDELLSRLLQETHRRGLWSGVIPLAALLDRNGRRQVLGLSAWRDGALRRAALAQATVPGQRPHVLGIVAEAESPQRERLLAALLRAAPEAPA